MRLSVDRYQSIFEPVFEEVPKFLIVGANTIWVLEGVNFRFDRFGDADCSASPVAALTPGVIASFVQLAGLYEFLFDRIETLQDFFDVHVRGR